ncbi:MAG: serine/threonine protein kinase [Myxococcales bacterium]|nr:serine/threonine protein kinase [Myxococcales bacterium]
MMAVDGPLLGGRWRLGAALGHGSQAQTFLAVEVARRVEVVVKRVKLGAGWKSFELHERETKVLGQLRHAGIPRLHAAFEEPPGTFNLIMQRMPGTDLRALVGKQRLSELELKDILVRGLEILDYLATRTPPVVHRDVKPSNLVRDRDGTLALVDFGGVADGASAGGSTLVGTYGYMAPEQLHGQVTPATDLYSLGATIVALAGGTEPEDVPRKGLTMDLAKHLPAMSKPLRAALAAMVEPDPDKRPARPRDVLAMLARAPEPEPLPAPRPAATALTAPTSRALARPVFVDVPEPLRMALRIALLGTAAGGWLALAILALTVRALGGALGLVSGRGRRPAVRAATADVAGVLTDGQDGFGDLARRSVARARR